MKRLFVAGAVVLAMAASSAAAQGRAQGPAGQRLQQARARQQAAVFQRLDKNNDGSLSRDEWPRAQQAFDRVDANKDGVLSREETGKLGGAVQRVRQARGRQARVRVAKMRVRRMDGNRDRVISRNEWKGRPEPFDRLDTNKDGQLTPAEIRARGKRR